MQTVKQKRVLETLAADARKAAELARAEYANRRGSKYREQDGPLTEWLLEEGLRRSRRPKPKTETLGLYAPALPACARVTSLAPSSENDPAVPPQISITAPGSAAIHVGPGSSIRSTARRMRVFCEREWWETTIRPIAESLA